MLFKGEFVFKIALNYPEVEKLCSVKEFIVGVLIFCFVCGVAGNYSVNKSVGKMIFVFYPLAKALFK